ncbi:hypothetical protein FG93_04894 [Bosea sp. LC85]|uniref:hypothetical protein n=1 Tax=Bosea sp. LC85 TaxID=1502851 RepID=UPI0004E326A8|nr:hypothetical protein [Bosea sp. LC85]KFC65353.1 hypothetical protein FG93_04894 [Bosea sp. LC85]
MKTSIKHDSAGSGGSPVIKLESPADYKHVMERIAGLKATPKGEDEERELAALQEAARDWESGRPRAAPHEKAAPSRKD